MKKKSLRYKMIVLSIIPLFLGASFAAIAVTQKSTVSKRIEKRPKFVEGEVLVKYKNSTSLTQRNSSIQSIGGKKIAEFGGSGFVQVKTSDGMSTNDAMTMFRKDTRVESVQPNYIYYASSVPNDTNYGSLWGLKNGAQTIASPSYLDAGGAAIHNPGSSGMDMDLEHAWDYSKGSSSVIVAVVDSGVNYTHEDLAANMWDGGTEFPNHGFDCVGSNDNDPMDMNGHGTHVAGTIGAVGNNNKGTTGVCWNVKIMAVRVLDVTGSGTTADIVEGLNWAVAHGAKIINMSLGGTSFDSAFYSALSSAETSGVAVIVAAGNGGNDGVGDDLWGTSGDAESYPCEYPIDNIVCVGAVDQSYAIASFSNYGISVDVAAPGTNIMSTWNGTWTDLAAEDFYTWTKGGNWGNGTVSIKNGASTVPANAMYLPKTWNGVNAYAVNDNSVAKKYFDLSAVSPDAIKFGFVAYIDTESPAANGTYYDYLGILFKSGNFDPSTGLYLDKLAGTTRSTTGTPTVDEFMYFEYAQEKPSSTFTLGYQFKSDGSVQKTGIGLVGMTVSYLKLASNKYNIIDGTSMATPHVAGLAALIKSYNPDYTYEDIIASIKGGSDVVPGLSDKIYGNRVADAFGSIKYIQPPTNVTAEIQ